MEDLNKDCSVETSESENNDAAPGSEPDGAVIAGEESGGADSDTGMEGVDSDGTAFAGLDLGETRPEEGRTRLPFWLGILVGIAAMSIVMVAVILITGLRLKSSSATSDTSSAETENVWSAAQTKLNMLTKYIDKYYLGDIDSELMEESLADGLITGLGDKYAEYYTVEEFADLIESTEGAYCGIGVAVVQTTTGEIYIYTVYSGSPAEEAGLMSGDIIVEADGVREFEDLDDLVSIVKGEEGTTVDLVILRDEEEIPVTVERRTIELDTVSYEMLDNNIGYIYIEQFDKVTAEQFNQALDDLESQGMESLILDLRDNPGGDYDTVVAMADRVLPEGPIMTVKDNQGNIKTENSDAENYLDLPMAVLINENSASAAEVFVGAIQDYNMATIVGKTSYGKGVVQSVYKFPDGSGVKFTTEQYYTPSGDSIHGVGIVPDIEVDLPEDIYDDGIFDFEEDTQLQAAIEALS